MGGEFPCGEATFTQMFRRVGWHLLRRMPLVDIPSPAMEKLMVV